MMGTVAESSRLSTGGIVMKRLRGIGVAGLGLLGAIYLLNPTAGLFELIPDNLPVIGNLDEAAATGLVLWALRYFGFDLGRWFRREPPPATR